MYYTPKTAASDGRDSTVSTELRSVSIWRRNP